MLRKTLLGAAAGLTLAVAALAPSSASAKGVHLHIGGPGYWGASYGYGYGYGYEPFYGPDCFYKKVKVWSHKWDKWIWKTKKVCY